MRQVGGQFCLPSQQVVGVGIGLTDDNFFHLTCHIDSGLQQKIEQGAFVDLDKLLPKDKTLDFSQSYSNETKLEWVQREGREIWQYISVINTASMHFNWDNVYHYNVIFRQVMEFNPSRSWAVTYNQMWNLSITNPISTRRGNFTNQLSNQSQNGATSSGNKFNRKKNDYCWSFNRGNKCKFGKRCRFIEHCSYCDSPTHGLVNCEKLDKKDKDTNVSNKKSRSGRH